MSELINRLSEMGADSGYNMTEEHNKLVRQFEEAKRDILRVRYPQTDYEVGDRVAITGLQNSEICLECKTAGKSADGELSNADWVIGATINDGSIAWEVVTQYAVRSVNGNTGDVTVSTESIGAAEKVHAHSIGDVTDLQSILDNKAPFDHSHPIVAHNHVIADVTGLREELDNIQPIGTVAMSVSASVPKGWLYCNGAAVSRETYKELFYRIGTLFGVGDSVTTFNLPDFRGRTPWGADIAGTYIEAGLPNIEGALRPFMATTDTPAGEETPSGAFYKESDLITKPISTVETGSLNIFTVGFDASISNDTYGNSETVQPPALTVRFYIKY